MPQAQNGEATAVLVVAFDFDLTRADSRTLEVGALRVRGDDFVSFEWFLDADALSARLNPLVAGMFLGLPETMRAIANNWPAYRNRSVPSWMKVDDPKTLAEYYCAVFGHQSSIFISGVRSS